MEFQSHWLDYTVEGQPVRDWCQRLKGDTRKARCMYCNVSVWFGVNPVMSFKKHALSRRHRQNRKKAQRGLKKAAGYSAKQMRPKQVIDACNVLYPGMNFNCSVNLLPLGVLHKTSNQVRNSTDLVSLLRWLVRTGMKKTFIDVYVCFHCGEEFASRLTLQDHQRGCNMKSPGLQAAAHFNTPAVRHQYGCRTPPRHHAVYNTPAAGISTSSVVATRQQVAYPSVWPSQDSFIAALGLLPKKAAALVCNKRRNTQCENIDLDDDIPISPTLPRTPKLLISHLSRDGSEKYGENSPSRVKRILFSSQHSQSDEEVNNGKRNDDSDNDGEKKSEERTKISHAKSLYSLDLTSPLGQFVIQHIKGDPNLHVLSDIESHCLTSAETLKTPAIKLRDRHTTYPVTFRGFTGKTNPTHVHAYKFTRQQTAEFLQRVNTGLDKRSRGLLRKMRMCKVRLKRLTRAEMKKWTVSSLDVTVDLRALSAEEIRFWTSAKAVVDQDSCYPAVFPRGLSFSSPNVNKILGLKTCQDATVCKRYNLSVSNYVSEEACAEATENRRAVYKSLLSDSYRDFARFTKSPSAFEPALRQRVMTHGLHTVYQGQGHPVQDFTDSKILTPGTLTLPSASLVSFCPVDNSKEGAQCVHSPVLRDTCYPDSKISSLLTCEPSKLHNISDQVTRMMSEGKTGEPAPRSVWSGIYNVRIRTALEGKVINNAVINYPKVFSSSKVTHKIKPSGDDKQKFVNRKFHVKPFNALKHSVPNLVRKRHLRGTDASKSKKRRMNSESVLDKESQISENSITMTSMKNGLHKSVHERPEASRKETFLVDKIQISREDADQRLRDSFCPSFEKQIPSQMKKAENTKNEFESYKCDAYIQQSPVKQNENNKCLGGYGKRVTVASFFNCNLENCHRCIVCRQTNTSQSLKIKSLQKDLKKVSGRYMSPSHLNNHSLNCAKTDAHMKKSQHVSQMYIMKESERTNRMKSRSSLSSDSDSINEAIKVAKKSFLQVNTSSDSEVTSPKDVSHTGVRFVSYSLPSSPQLRQSSLMNTISIPRKAEVRKSLLSSFLLKTK